MAEKVARKLKIAKRYKVNVTITLKTYADKNICTDQIQEECQVSNIY